MNAVDSGQNISSSVGFVFLRLTSTAVSRMKAMRKQRQFLTVLLILCAWPGASTAQAQSPGTVGAWGYNSSGQTNVPVAAQSGVTAIAAGAGHTVALKNDGSVVAWGFNEYGQATVPVEAQSKVEAIAAGEYHTVVLINPTAPTIITQPVSQTVNVWQSPIFTVTATGFPL